MVIVVLLTLGGATISHSISEKRVTERYTESIKALSLAEAGLDRGLWEFNYGDGNWSNWTDVGVNGKQLTADLDTLGSYRVTISDITDNNPVITASGHIPDLAVSRLERSIEASVNRESNSPFSYAGFGKEFVKMTGNGETDSYNSNDGAYDEDDNLGANGDIGTNSGDAGAIDLQGNATVNGDAGTGENGTVEVSGNAEVNGDTSDDVAEDMPPVEVPEALTSLSSGGNYGLNGNNDETLTEGDYRYNSLSISGSASLTIIGSVRLYLTHANSLRTSGNGILIIDSDADLTIYTNGRSVISGNGIANETNVPANFLLYSAYSGNNGVQITGNGDIYGAIYAPYTNVKVTGNGNLYGSLIGKDLTVTGNGDLHYDEALSDVEGGSITYVMQLWQDLQTPY